MNKGFDFCAPRRGTSCFKWDALAEEYGRADLLPYWIADTEFATLPAITEALIERLKKPVYSYTFPDDGFFNSIIHWYQKRYGVSVAREEIFPLPAIMFGIGRILETFTEKGDKVILNTPVYESYLDTAPRLGRVIADAPLKKQGEHYDLDFEAIERRMQEGAKAYILCTPHNPVGRIWSEEDLRRVASLCCKYHVILIADEIHSDIIFGGRKHHPAFSVSEEAAQCTIMFNSTAKTFNTASLKTAYIICKNKDYLAKVRESVALYHLGVPFLGCLATKVAYEQGDSWVDEQNAYLEENAEFVYAFIKEHLPRIKTFVPESTFLMWFDFRDCGMTHKELMRFLVEKAGLALSDGTHYGPAYQDFARFNIGAPRAFLEEGLNRLVDAFASIK